MSPYIDTNTLESRCYRNISKHTVGVIKLREYDGKPNAVALKPDEKVHLNSIEERLTGNAPKSQAANPFKNGELAMVDEAAETAAVEAAATEAALEETPEEAPTEETPADVAPGAPKAPEADLPPAAMPGAQDPRTAPAPVQGGSLEEVAEEAAQAAEDSGEPPTEEHAVSHTEETGVEIKPEDQEEVVGERAATEEVATPEAAPKSRRKSASSKRAGK